MTSLEAWKGLQPWLEPDVQLFMSFHSKNIICMCRNWLTLPGSFPGSCLRSLNDLQGKAAEQQNNHTAESNHKIHRRKQIENQKQKP